MGGNGPSLQDELAGRIKDLALAGFDRGSPSSEWGRSASKVYVGAKKGLPRPGIYSETKVLENPRAKMISSLY